MSDLESESTSLIKKLLKIFALSLKLKDPDFFIKAHTCLDDLTVPSFSTLRALYYPPCDKEPLPAGTVRCGEHTDYGMLTLLFQDDVGGLEVNYYFFHLCKQNQNSC
jgi:isopenicillin N synthase-like dioxygenase